MSMISYRMTGKDLPFTRVEEPVPAPGPGEALVEIAGCGVCHTDLGFWHDGVPTRQAPPLTLGHEISGVVLAGPDALAGRPVIVPAVLPCGECDLCRSGRSNICQKQKMPGNDFHGGFATHIVAPARFLCPVPDAVLENHTLAQLSVIADAVSTPYQVIVKSGLAEGDVAIVIGVGGVGMYAAQIARAFGATVLALDVALPKLELVEGMGAHTVHTAGMAIPDVKKRVKEILAAEKAPPYGWKIYEMSGTTGGQELAFALLGIAGTLSVVGFTLAKLELRLSNLMAFDATAIGTWGCKPELYPKVVELVAEGRVQIKPHVELFRLEDIDNVFRRTLEHAFTKRSVMVPHA